MTAWHRLRIPLMSLRILSCGSRAYPSRSAALLCWTVVGLIGLVEIPVWRMYQKCFIGFKSVEHAGSSILHIAAVSWYPIGNTILCWRALSSIKIWSRPITIHFIETCISVTLFRSFQLQSLYCKQILLNDHVLIKAHACETSGVRGFAIWPCNGEIPITASLV